MRKAFAQNIAFLVLLNLIVKPVWIFGIDRNVQNVAGHEVYGLYVALLNLTIIFQVVLDFGLQSYNNRKVAQNPHAIQELFPNILFVKLVLAAIYALLVLGVGFVLGYGSTTFLLLLLLVAMQTAASFHLFFRSNISAMQHFKTDSFFSVLDRLVVILIMSALLFLPAYRQRFQIEWFAWAQLIALLVAGSFAFWHCLRFIKNRRLGLKMGLMQKVLKDSLPYALLIFLMGLYMKVDVILLEQWGSDASIAGKYAAVGRLLDVGNNMTGVLFAGILLPLFGKMLAIKEDVRPIIHLTVNVLLPLSLLVWIISFFYGKPILDLLYHDMTEQDARMLWVLMIAFPCYCINYVYSTLLTANGNIRVLVWISLGAVLVNVGLNTLLIPFSGSKAGLTAALVAAITLVGTSIANLYFSIKMMKLKWDWPWMIRLFCFGVLLFFAAYLLSNVFDGLNFIQQILILLLVFGVAIFALRLISFSELLKMTKAK